MSPSPRVNGLIRRVEEAGKEYEELAFWHQVSGIPCQPRCRACMRLWFDTDAASIAYDLAVARLFNGYSRFNRRLPSWINAGLSEDEFRALTDADHPSLHRWGTFETLSAPPASPDGGGCRVR